MNYSTTVLLVNDAIRVVKGQYQEDGKPGVFKTLEKDLKVDDFAVVESGTRWGITTVKITEVDTVDVDFDSSIQVGWVVQKIDMKSHQDVKVMENKAIDIIKKGEIRKRREDIRKNTLDAYCAGEMDTLGIGKLGALPPN
jgi:hypothetical protein